MSGKSLIIWLSVMFVAGCSTQDAPCHDPTLACHVVSRSAATDFESIKHHVMLPKNSDDLLARVKTAGATDPSVLTVINAVSSLVMDETWKKSPSAREIWSCALLGAAERAKEEDRKMFFLGQLRQCGKSTQAERIMQIGRKSGSEAVNELASQIAAELVNREIESTKQGLR